MQSAVYDRPLPRFLVSNESARLDGKLWYVGRGWGGGG